MRSYQPGDPVHVASLGRGVVREVRNAGRYLVEIKGRAMLVGASQITPLSELPPKQLEASSTGPPPADSLVPSTAPSSLDLHGMTRDEAVTALDSFLNDAMLAGLGQVQVIHGRSGGRIRAAVHQRLRAIASVRSFRIDGRNPGVTIVTL